MINEPNGDVQLSEGPSEFTIAQRELAQRASSGSLTPSKLDERLAGFAGVKVSVNEDRSAQVHGIVRRRL